MKLLPPLLPFTAQYMDCIGSHCVGQRGSTEKNNNTSTLPSNSVQQLPVEKMSEDHHHHTPSMDHNHPSQMEMKVNSRQEGEEESGGHSHLRTPACNPSTDLSSDFCKCKILLNFEDVSATRAPLSLSPSL